MTAPGYVRAGSLEEALALLAEHGDDAKVLAGGQSLIPLLSAGFVTLDLLIDINRLPGLDHIVIEQGVVRVGALVRHRSLEFADERVSAAFPLFPAAARLIAHAPIRNRGTFVGSLAQADPSAEWPAVAVASDAQIRLVSHRGERVIRAADFFVGPLTATIEPDEIAVEVVLPVVSSRTGVAVRELTYRAGDYAVVGVVAQLSLAETGHVSDCRLALFSVDATPLRVPGAEAAIRDGGLRQIGDAAELAAAAANPQSDATASAAYRRDMIRVYCRRALEAAFHAASSDSKATYLDTTGRPV
jgi:aerobic carbon-monoxide dehydrogenase medium subunit